MTAVGSVGRAVALLDVLGAAEGPLGVNELARRIEVSPSTASRLLATLESGGLVARDAGGPYRLGLRLVELAGHVLAGLDLRELARPVLTALVQETRETATLSVPGAEGAITVEFVPSPSTVASMARIGRLSVPHATAAGKVVLAFTSHALGAELHRYTEQTITDPVALERELDLVRRRGWAQAVREREPDLAAVAVPVLDRAGELVAILGLQGPAARLPAAARAGLREALQTAARRLASEHPAWYKTA